MVIFDDLKREDIHKIIDIELLHLVSRIKELGYNLSVTEKAKDFIMEKGWDPNFGARPLKRAIQKYIEDSLAEEIIKGKLDGDIIIDFDDVKEEIFIKTETVKKPAKEKKK